MPVRFNGGGGGAAPGGGDSTGEWAEDATVNDLAVVGSVLAEDAVVSDELGSVRVALADDATVDDAFSVLVVPSWAEDATAGDDLAVMVHLADDATVDDAFALMVARLAEDAVAADDLAVSTMLAEDATSNDLAKVRAIISNTARTGSPSTDLLQEAHVVQASATTNFGNATTMPVQARTATNTQETIGFVAIDLTKLASMTAQAVATPFSMTLAVTHNSLINENLIWDLRRHTARPFVEDSVTWDTKPSSTLGTSVASGTAVIATGATPTVVTFTLSESLLNSSLTDGWLFLVLTNNSTVLRPVLTVRARENATAADRPALDLLLQRGT